MPPPFTTMKNEMIAVGTETDKKIKMNASKGERRQNIRFTVPRICVFGRTDIS